MGNCMTYEDAEQLRKSLKINIKSFCEILGVSRQTYYLWKKRGISPTAGQLLILLDKNPWKRIEELLED